MYAIKAEITDPRARVFELPHRRRRGPHDQWNDGQPATELNFKFYRQATNKIVSVSAEVATFLEAHF